MTTEEEIKWMPLPVSPADKQFMECWAALGREIQRMRAEDRARIDRLIAVEPEMLKVLLDTKKQIPG